MARPCSSDQTETPAARGLRTLPSPLGIEGTKGLDGLFGLRAIRNNLQIEFVILLSFCDELEGSRGFGQAKDRIYIGRIVAESVFVTQVGPTVIPRLEVKAANLGISLCSHLVRNRESVLTLAVCVHAR